MRCAVVDVIEDEQQALALLDMPMDALAAHLADHPVVDDAIAPEPVAFDEDEDDDDDDFFEDDDDLDVGEDDEDFFEDGDEDGDEDDDEDFSDDDEEE